LIIGWGTSVKIASIRANTYGAVNGSYKPIPISNGCQVDIVASFQTNYYISGIAPFGDSLAILAYIPGKEDGEKNFSTTAPSRQVILRLSGHLSEQLEFKRFNSLNLLHFSKKNSLNLLQKVLVCLSIISTAQLHRFVAEELRLVGRSLKICTNSSFFVTMGGVLVARSLKNTRTHP